jgi:argininosuccinate lyase
MTKKVWGGRFKEETDPLVDKFNASIGFDFRLYPYDIKGSIAHCRMLAKQKIITRQDAALILKGLEEIKAELDNETPPSSQDYEDIHSLVEKRLIEKTGSVGEKLHTGRSRNDQVALDMRIYVKDAIDNTLDLIKKNRAALVELAEKHYDSIMPGYTHLQRAQPVLLAHHLLAYYEMLKRDSLRFEDARKRLNILPLGSAALAGATFNFDREMVADLLGFDEISQNSMDAVSDRDFAVEFMFDCSLLMMHLSRFAEELVLWSSQEFGYATISDAFSTGSSIMPQKKNPDIPELVRGKTGRVYGNLLALLTTMKGLPLAYNKDMQEDKEALFDTDDTTRVCLEVMSRLLKEISFDTEKMKAAAGTGFLTATDLADYLVRRGETFRQAHKIVGQIVVFAMDNKKELHELDLDEMKGFSDRIETDIYEYLEPSSCINARNITGGTGPDAVKAAILKAKKETGLCDYDKR